MQVSAFAERVQAQLAASRALLRQAPRCELTPAARALLALANASGQAPRAQRGNGSAPLLLVLFLACALGTGIGYGVMHIGGQLADAIAQTQARR